MNDTSFDVLLPFLQNALSPYHAADCAKQLLRENGFIKLYETDDFELQIGGKYFVERGGCLLAFTVGNLDRFTFKIAASHMDSPCLKLKANPLKYTENCVSLNVETYGGGIWYSFLDRPLRIAGRVVVKRDNKIVYKTVTSPFVLTIPSVAVHQNRNVNDGFAINAQVDLLPLLSLRGGEEKWLNEIVGDENVLSYDLFVVNADMPYAFGVNNEFLASPRLDNLTSVCASIEALIAKADSDGICMAALFNHEEIGSSTTQGAGGDFMENVLKRIGYAFHFDENEFYKALASSFLLSVDNAHALHPNHPEKSDVTNKTLLGGGVVIKSHANGNYVTESVSEAIIKTIFDNAGVSNQTFFNRSDVRSGSTLGRFALTRMGLLGADIGLAQLAMHSAVESFVLSDYTEMVNGLTAFFSTEIITENDGWSVR